MGSRARPPLIEHPGYQEDEENIMPTAMPLPATFDTTESFPTSVGRPRMDVEVDLRIKAGAIRSRYEEQGANYILTTTWNVIGGNA
jgi:hypothetical protein